jgi:hypothetical protein
LSPTHTALRCLSGYSHTFCRTFPSPLEPRPYARHAACVPRSQVCAGGHGPRRASAAQGRRAWCPHFQARCVARVLGRQRTPQDACARRELQRGLGRRRCALRLFYEQEVVSPGYRRKSRDGDAYRGRLRLESQSPP